MSRVAPLWVSLALAFGTGCGGHFDVASANGFQIIAGKEARYYAYVPADAAERVQRGESLPVILYLHGEDERGSDGELAAQVGLGSFVDQSHGAFPFVVLFPQCPKGRLWTAPEEQAHLGRVLDEALPRLGGDRDRVYVTGTSMGGYGAWLLAANNPGRFAALVPISAGVRPSKNMTVQADTRFGALPDPYSALAQALGSIPTWIFHGANDPLVSPEEMQSLATALHARGNQAKLTLYAGVGHGASNRAYADPVLFTWLAQQRRGQLNGTKPASKAAAGK